MQKYVTTVLCEEDYKDGKLFYNIEIKAIPNSKPSTDELEQMFLNGEEMASSFLKRLLSNVPKETTKLFYVNYFIELREYYVIENQDKSFVISKKIDS